jgi:hypothetical protein
VKTVGHFPFVCDEAKTNRPFFPMNVDENEFAESSDKKLKLKSLRERELSTFSSSSSFLTNQFLMLFSTIIDRHNGE